MLRTIWWQRLGKLVSFAQAMHSKCKDDQMKHTYFSFCKQGRSYAHNANTHKHRHTNLKNRLGKIECASHRTYDHALVRQVHSLYWIKRTFVLQCLMDVSYPEEEQRTAITDSLVSWCNAALPPLPTISGFVCESLNEIPLRNCKIGIVSDNDIIE